MCLTVSPGYDPEINFLIEKNAFLKPFDRSDGSVCLSVYCLATVFSVLEYILVKMLIVPCFA